MHDDIPADEWRSNAESEQEEKSPEEPVRSAVPPVHQFSKPRCHGTRRSCERPVEYLAIVGLVTGQGVAAFHATQVRGGRRPQIRLVPRKANGRPGAATRALKAHGFAEPAT